MLRQSGAVIPSTAWVILCALAVILAQAASLSSGQVALGQTSRPRAPEEVPPEEKIPPPTPTGVGPEHYVLAVPDVLAIDTTTYRLGPGDELRLVLPPHSGLKPPDRVVVSADGTFVPDPVFGAVRVGGLTLSEAEETVAQVVRRYYRNVEPALQLVKLRQFPVTVLGSVTKPGTYYVTATTRLSSLLDAAVPTESASSRDITITSRTGEVRRVDWLFVSRALTEEGDPTLEADDEVRVGVKGPTVTVDGAVRVPGEYEMREGETLYHLLQLAGGLTEDAVPGAAHLTRTAGGKPEVVEADFDALLRVVTPDDSLVLQGGEELFVPSAEQVLGTVEIVGEVNRQGRFPIYGGLTLTRLVEGLARGLTQLAGERYIELERQGPDGQRELQVIDYAAIKAGLQDDVDLQANDRIFVPEYSTRAPRVALVGAFVPPPDAEAPHEERTEFIFDLERLSDFIARIGGIAADGDRHHVQIERTDAEGRLARQTVNLDRVAAGLEEDPVLQGGDRITVPGWEVFQPKVFVRGEVLLAGTTPLAAQRQEEGASAYPSRPYVIREGEPVSELLARIGGVSDTGDSHHVRVERIRPDGTLEPFTVDVVEAAADRTKDLELQDGDDVIVPPIDFYLPHVVLWGQVVLREREEVVGQAEPSRLVEAISEGETIGELFDHTGYLAPTGDPTHVQLKRMMPEGEPTRLIVNLQAVWSGEQPDVELQDLDEIFVPKRDTYAPQITIRGEFRGVGVYPEVPPDEQPVKEGIYAIAEGDRVSTVVENIGGLTANGSPERIYLERYENGVARIIPVDLNAIRADPQSDIPLQGGDVLEAPARELFAEKVTLIGEFAQAYRRGGTVAVSTTEPGAAPRVTMTVRRGERVRDVVQLAGGPTADAALSQAYIDRPQPEGAMERIPVDLFSVLVYPLSERGTGMNIEMQNGDELYLPRIEDSVYFLGSVTKQGPVAYQPERRFTHYLGLAGGGTERAKLTEVLIARRTEEGRQPIVINAKKALAGDPKEDIIMEPGDVVVITDTKIHGVMDLLRTLAQLSFLVRLF